MPHINTEELLTISQAAREMNCSTSWLYLLIQRGKAESITVAGVQFIHRKEVERLKKEHQQQ